MLIDSALRPRRGFLGTSALFQAAAIRKQTPQLSHHLVWTAQEAVDVGSASKTLRQDVYEKIMSGGRCWVASHTQYCAS